MLERVLLAMCFTSALLLTAGPGRAGTNDVLIGLDQKITYGPDGPVNGAPGKDEVLIMDISTPAKPKIRARLPLMNSLLGPPTNLQITPDGKLGLVANSVLHTPADATAYKVSPDNRLFVIDLTAEPPRLVDTLEIGKQPSGMAISRKGDLALVANRNGRSVSVLSIMSGKVTVVGEVSVEQEAAAIAITPDGKRAFVCLNLVNKIAVLSIDGTRVTYDKTMDIPVAFNPYNADVTPNGKFVIVSTTGAGKNHADAMVVIEAGGPHPRVVDLIAPGAGPEGFTISPDGKWVVAALLLGSGAKQSDWWKTKGGELVLLSLDPVSGEMGVRSRVKVGGLPEGVVFSPKSDYVYVGNYFDSDIQVFRISGEQLIPAGPALKLGGQPASMRGIAR